LSQKEEKKPMTIEEVDEVLASSKSVSEIVKCRSSKWKEEEKEDLDFEFERVRKFKINNQRYMIIWYVNILYFFEEGSDLFVIFDRFEEKHTWPTQAKMNLQFYLNGEVCCVLPIFS
jgi:hypothetical protein